MKEDIGIIIHTPTLKIFERVVSYALNTNGCKWFGMDKNLNLQIWNINKHRSCVRISETEVNYSSYDHYSEICGFPILTIYDFSSMLKSNEILKEFI